MTYSPLWGVSVILLFLFFRKSYQAGVANTIIIKKANIIMLKIFLAMIASPPLLRKLKTPKKRI